MGRTKIETLGIGHQKSVGGPVFPSALSANDPISVLSASDPYL
jgi:hypothetical protein